MPSHEVPWLLLVPPRQGEPHQRCHHRALRRPRGQAHLVTCTLGDCAQRLMTSPSHSCPVRVLPKEESGEQHGEITVLAVNR